MSYTASYSSLDDTRQAVEAVCRDVRERLQGAQPDLSFLFVSPDHADRMKDIAAVVDKATGSRNLLGCTGETIVGGGEEIENRPAVSLWSGVLPGARLETFHVEFERTPDGLICSGLPEASGDSTEPRTIFLLGEPYTCAVDALIERLDGEYPGVPLIGGMASGGRGPDENRLYLNGERIEQGGVGVIVQGGPPIRSTVSQGCRQIGQTFVVTRADRNIIYELGGGPPLVKFQELFQTLSDHDRELVRKGLHLGIAMNEFRPRFERGDFLVTNVIDADRESGAIAIGNFVRTGQTVQFHVRDAATADEDLRHLLQHQLEQQAALPRAALLFSCNGRGTRLFPEPNHDASVIQELCGPLPLAGFFAQGELGPVGGKNYIHGFTASVALFEKSV